MYAYAHFVTNIYNYVYRTLPLNKVNSKVCIEILY